MDDHYVLVRMQVTAANQNPPRRPGGFITVNFSYSKRAQIAHSTQLDGYTPIASFNTSFHFDLLCRCILRQQLLDAVPISSPLLDFVVSQILYSAHNNLRTSSAINVILEAIFFNALEKVEAQEYASEDCCICLEKLFDGSSASMKVVRSTCRHVFHQDCIVRWLSASNCCPLCRFLLSA